MSTEELAINNPCMHIGVESFVCEVCGYPDPAKMIAALKGKLMATQVALRNMEEYVALLPGTKMEVLKENAAMKAKLYKLAQLLCAEMPPDPHACEEGCWQCDFLRKMKYILTEEL